MSYPARSNDSYESRDRDRSYGSSRSSKNINNQQNENSTKYQQRNHGSNHRSNFNSSNNYNTQQHKNHLPIQSQESHPPFDLNKTNTILTELTSSMAPFNLPTQSTQIISEEADADVQLKRFNSILHAKKLPCYELYLTAVPKFERNRDLKHANHPQTPPHSQQMSKRKWVGKYDQWVGLLKGWDGGGSGYDSLDAMKAGRVRRLIDFNTSNSNSNSNQQQLNQQHQTLEHQNNVHVHHGSYQNESHNAQINSNSNFDEVKEEEEEALREAMRLADLL